jgi:hypothetical protein
VNGRRAGRRLTRTAVCHPLVLWLGVACALSACTFWPASGAGGMAELRPPARPVSGHWFGRWFGRADPAWLELDQQRRQADCHLEALVLQGAELCLPAHVVAARERQRRIVRALYGGLPLDAANDLIILRERLAELQRRLDYIQANGACVTPAMAGAAARGGG